MTIYTAKVNGEFLRAAREENWTWEEAQENLKQTYGEDAVIELVSSFCGSRNNPLDEVEKHEK